MSPPDSSVVYDPRGRFQSFRIGPAPMADVPLSVSEVLIAHRLGINHSTAKTISTVQETIVKVRPEPLPPLSAIRDAGAAAETPRTLRRGCSTRWSVVEVDMACSLISGSPPFLCPFDELPDHSDDQDRDEQDDRGGRGRADPVVGERGAGDQAEQHLGRDAGPAGGHQVDLVEDL